MKTELQLLQERHGFNIWDKLDDSKFNLIEAKAGAGKTTEVLKWVFESEENIYGELHNQFIYVSDTTNLKEQTKDDYVKRLSKTKDIPIENLYIKGRYNDYIPKSMKCMTYQGFIYWLERNQDNPLIFDNKVFILDECHNFAKYVEDFPEQYEFIGEGLQLLKDSFSTVICLSATPNKFIDLMFDYEIEYYDVLGDYKHELIGYKSNHIFKYNDDLVSFMQDISFSKALIYFAGSVDSMKAYAEALTKRNINTQYICADKKASLDSRETKKIIRTTHEIPTHYDVIMFNDSMGTGINILDQNHDIDTFITFATKYEYLDVDDEYQARMRIRHDIEVEYHFTKKRDIKKADKDIIRQYEETNRRIDLIEDVLDQELTTEKFSDLAIQLDFRTNKSKVIMKPWDEIEALRYKVQRPTNSKRFTKISK